MNESLERLLPILLDGAPSRAGAAAFDPKDDMAKPLHVLKLTLHN
jgi:hypothetical protein